jgi:hypothetical protein
MDSPTVSIRFWHSPPILKTTLILLANSEAPKFRLTYYPSEGTEAWSNPCGNLGFVGGDIGSPTVSGRFRDILPRLLHKQACIWANRVIILFTSMRI